MVNLIASDIDGTLLQGQNYDISENAKVLIEKLLDKGIYFAAASGRQRYSLEQLFGKLAGRIIYISDNGALITYKGRELYRKSMNKDKAIALLKDIYGYNKCEFLVSCGEMSYVMPKNAEFESMVKDRYKWKVKKINSYDEIPDGVIKVTLYNPDGMDMSSDYFYDRWSDVFKSAVSGQYWMDFVDLDVNKGVALKKVQEIFNVESEFTMCFGDNYNDLEMFDAAYFSYAMSGANSEIRAAARYVAPSVETILYDIDKYIQ